MHFSSLALHELVTRLLEEDIGYGDITTLAIVPPQARGHGCLLAKEALVLAGLEIAEAVFPNEIRSRSEENPQTELNSPRFVRLAGNHTPVSRAEHIHTGICWLETVQNVYEFETERCADALTEMSGLSHRQIEVPTWETPENTPEPPVEPQDHRPETAVDGLRVGEHVNPRPVDGRVACATR